MSTEVDIFSQGGAVATTGRRDDGFTANITGSSSTSKRISIRNNVFRLVVNGKEIDKSEARHLDVVIVNASTYVHRMYFSGEYKPGMKVSPPACWTADSIKPDEAVENPQSSTCTTCPQNIKGSGPNGTKACRFSRRIAVVREDDLDGDVFQVTLPSQSIFGNGNAERRPLHEYTDYVRANNQNLMSVVSRMSFDMDSSSTKVGFKPIRVLNDDEYSICAQKSLSDDAKRAITLTVSVSKEESNSEEFEQIAKPKPAPQPVDAFTQTNEEEEIPEPVKRTEAKPAPAPKAEPTPAPKADVGDVSLDDLVSDWT
jgi:hypothetical protein